MILRSWPHSLERTDLYEGDLSQVWCKKTKTKKPKKSRWKLFSKRNTFRKVRHLVVFCTLYFFHGKILIFSSIIVQGRLFLYNTFPLFFSFMRRCIYDSHEKCEFMWWYVLGRQLCDFPRHYKYDKCQFLRDDSTHWTWHSHTTVSDLDRISRPQQCQSVFTENMFLFV